MQTRIEPRKSATYAFRSLAELGEYIANTKRTWRSNDSRDYREAFDWDLYTGFDSAVNMARNGWLEGAQKVQEALKAFRPLTPAPDTQVDFYGFRPHVPRFCAGAPDSMIRHSAKPVTGAGRVLTLAVPVNAIASVSAAHMANFGVAVAQYVNQLETDGTRVELIGMIVSEVSGERVAHSWVVKYADQPLDLSVVAFSIGHPAMFRRLGFALRERSAVREDPGYGRTQPAKLSDLINPPLGTIILNGMASAGTHAPTAQAGLAYVAKCIETALQAQEL